MNLTDELRVRVGRTLAAAAILLAVGGLVVVAALGEWKLAWDTLAPVNATMGVGFGALAWTVLPRQPRNSSVWAYAWAAFFGGLYATVTAVLVLSTTDAMRNGPTATFVPADLPAPAGVAIGVLITIWLPAVFLPLTLGLVLFPDGHLPSRRWRWVVRYQATTMVVAVVSSLIYYNRWCTTEVTAVADTGTPLGLTVNVSIILAQLGAIPGFASLVVRYRTSDATVRRQVRWIASGGAVAVVGSLIFVLIDNGVAGDSPGTTFENLFNLIPLIVLIASFWVAITRYRLYEIDAIISKSVAYLGLAAVIAALYAAVVIAPLVVIGGTGDGGPGLALPIVAAAVVALVFEPVRARMQRWANRLVYGSRATPYEVLSKVTSSLSDDTADDGTDGLARLLAQGTGASRAVVWLLHGGVLHPAGAWATDGPAALEPLAVHALIDDELHESRPVHHLDEQIGALSIAKPPSDPITPADRELLTDVAAGAGLRLRNISLNRELERRALEVRASRQRLIAAQDAERHRLERDLHDGAQQQVVALKVKLGIVKTIAEREGADQIATLAVGLADETQQAVDALRAVAHGIYPPLLESEGLATAVRAIERTASIPLAVDVGGVGRYERHVEETVYFCVLETLERARMAGATDIGVAIADHDGALVTTVDATRLVAALDLTAIADRLDAALGTLVVTPQAGTGTRITASVPATALAGDPA